MSGFFLRFLLLSAVRLLVGGAVALLPLVSFAQYDLKVGEWKAYASFNSGVCGAGPDDKIFVSTTGGLLSYVPATGETQTYSRLDGLSEVSPVAAYYHPTSGNMFFGYNSGAIDVMAADGTISAITDILRNDFYTSKGINAIAGNSELLFFATDFGMVIYDAQKLLPQFTVAQFGSEAARLSVGAVAIFQQRVWVAVGNKGLYSASLTFPNLSDPAAWRKENGRESLPANVTINALGTLGNRLYAACGDVLRYREGDTWTASAQVTSALSFLSVWNNTISNASGGSVKIFDNNGNYSERYYKDGGMVATFPTANATYYVDIYRGLVRTQNTSDEVERIGPDGPASPNCRRMVAGKSNLYVMPGGDAGSFDYSGVYFYRRPQGWKQLAKGDGLHPYRYAANYARAYYDLDKDEVWAGSWGVGLSVLKDSTYTAFYDCNNTPVGISRAYSTCDSTSLDNSRVSGIGRDNKGNIWLSFSYGNPPLTCRAKDGTWYSYLPVYNAADMRDLAVDEFDTKWLIYSKNGIVVFNDKGTLANTADDKTLAIGAGAGRGNLPSSNVYSMALDRDGYMWIGTDKGVAVFYDTYSLSQGKLVDASLPVFEGRELFRYETINAIAVDGGNRKWFGTNSGLFLLSPDGTKMVAKYTTENSPLPANEIISLAVDHSTGEVFIGTTRGIISYRGDATAPATTCDALSVFPNPAYRAENEVITIRGALEDGLVRITDAAGMLVCELTAEGGTAIWNGLDAWGNRAQPGLYMALVTAPDGSASCVVSFSVLK